MNTSVKVVPLDRVPAPLLAVAVGALNGKVPTSLLSLDDHLGGALGRAISSGDFTGERDATLLFYAAKNPRRVLMVGLGRLAEMTRGAARRAAAVAGRKAAAIGVDQLAVHVAHEYRGGVAPAALGQVLIEGATHGAWQFRLKAIADAKPAVKTVDLIATREERPDMERGRHVGHAIAIGTRLARNLQALPGNICTPEYLALIARQLGRAYGFRVNVLNREEIQAEGMGGLIAVSQGSEKEPRFITLEHRGAGRTQPITFVGKGVTFDSGGISIKPAQNMEEMKYDMSGAAAVLGTFEVLGQLKPPVNVAGVIPSTENLPSGTALKPGDVVRSHLGKTIEIVNTDAEGRLILADALSYVRRFKPACVIDAATLTGAITVALGGAAVGLMGNDDNLVAEVLRAGDLAGERCWQLPMWDEYRELNKSEIADVKNSGGRQAGSISAGWFLREFVDGYPWVHLDIAGTAYTDAEQAWQGKGPVGIGVRLFTEFILGRARG
ncbi:MAG: leucyl aminopeptidase [Gemmatimonadetes bacterium]|nr:leucyl aminopeptidase [Gemmatimonadota bacterium]